jgi:hypothetical protein
MKYRLLGATEKTFYGADVMAILDYTDVAALGAATTGNLSVAPATTSGLMPAVGTTGTDTIPTGTAIRFKYMVLDTAFVSGSATGLAVTVGDSGSATRLMASTQLQSGQTPVSYVAGITNEYVPTGTNVYNAYFTSTAANLSTFTAGQMRLFFALRDLTALPLA